MNDIVAIYGPVIVAVIAIIANCFVVRWQIKNNNKKIDDQINSSTKSIQGLIDSNTKMQRFLLLADNTSQIINSMMSVRLIGQYEKDKKELSENDHFEIKESASAIITALNLIYVIINEDDSEEAVDLRELMDTMRPDDFVNIIIGDRIMQNLTKILIRERKIALNK